MATLACVNDFIKSWVASLGREVTDIKLKSDFKVIVKEICHTAEVEIDVINKNMPAAISQKLHTAATLLQVNWMKDRPLKNRKMAGFSATLFLKHIKLIRKGRKPLSV
jgi:hypothetical protein